MGLAKRSSNPYLWSMKASVGKAKAPRGWIGTRELSMKDKARLSTGRPPLDGLKRQIARGRSTAGDAPARRKQDSFIRETFQLQRDAAREKAREWFDTWPKAAYWTEVESWRALDGDQIEFTMRRLPTAD